LSAPTSLFWTRFLAELLWFGHSKNVLIRDSEQLVGKSGDIKGAFDQ
jgi:hypothetical protein